MITLSLSALAVILAPLAQGHGWITKPMARQLCDGRTAEGTFMPGGGNGAGPGMHDLGGVPGVCGDPFQSFTDFRSHFADEPCKPEAVYDEGSEMEVTVELSNQHGGFFEFNICPKATGLTEECFDKHLLITETGYPTYWATPSDKSGSVNVGNREVYTYKVKLPTGLTCEHCTVMWTWWTTHICQYDCPEEECGAYAHGGNPMPTGGSGVICPSLRPKKGETPQMFRACGDITIRGKGGKPGPYGQVLKNAKPKFLRNKSPAKSMYKKKRAAKRFPPKKMSPRRKKGRKGGPKRRKANKRRNGKKRARRGRNGKVIKRRRMRKKRMANKKNLEKKY